MRITKLDGLRGIFSLMVVIYHYPIQFVPDYFHDFFLIGRSYLFVDFFFVLSGFVISLNYHNLINTRTELMSFIQKRFIRLYPLLLYSTLLFFAMQLGVKVLDPQLAANKDSFLPSVMDTLDTLLFLNSTPVINDSAGMNYPSWSISAEMIAYIFFGLISLWTIGKRQYMVMATSIVVGMIFLVWVDQSGITTNYNFVRGILSFNIGYFVYHLRNERFQFGRWTEGLVFLGLLGVLYLSDISATSSLSAFIDSCLIPLFFGTAIFVIIHSDGFVSRSMDSRTAQYLGKISYSIYLNHAIVLRVVSMGIFSVLKVPQTPIIQFSVCALIVAIVIVYSHFTYKIVEVAGGRLLKRILSGRHPVAVPVTVNNPVNTNGRA